MKLTGPVPITNAVTEFSFKLFWQIFPLAIVLVALGLFVFTPTYSDRVLEACSGIQGSCNRRITNFMFGILDTGIDGLHGL